MTVSLALRNSGSISGAVRARIQNIADELGYRPNPLVSTLMAARAGGKSESADYPLAIVDLSQRQDWPDGTLFARAVFQGIRERAGELGFSVEVFRPPRLNAEGMAFLHRVFHARNIRGVIVAPGVIGFRIPSFPWEHYCAASLGYSVVDPPLHAVTSRQYGNALLLYEHLHQSGYRRIGLVTTEQFESLTMHHASAALHTHCRMHPENLEIRPLLLDAKYNKELLTSWLRKVKPDVVISSNDLTSRLRDCGRKVPQTLGFAILNTHNCVEENPSLTGLDIQPWHIGAASVETVVSHLHRNDFGLPRCPSTLMISGTVHVGTTTLTQKVPSK